MGIILAAKDTFSSRCTRMTRSSCLKLRTAVVACANARPRRCELASLVCHFVPYQNSGVLWTYELILGVLETSDYSVYAQYRSWVLYLDTRAALGGAQITISVARNARRDSAVNRKVCSLRRSLALRHFSSNLEPDLNFDFVKIRRDWTRSWM